jgi:hypothetical protein
LTFFGLTQNTRVGVFRQIHEIVFHGKGGYTWETVYNMPIWLRNYTFNLLEEHYSEKSKPEVSDKLNNTEIVVPDFITKAPKN